MTVYKIELNPFLKYTIETDKSIIGIPNREDIKEILYDTEEQTVSLITSEGNVGTIAHVKRITEDWCIGRAHHREHLKTTQIMMQEQETYEVDKTSTKENTNMYITLPRTLVEQLIHYYHTTNGLYATDLEIEAKKMTPNTFWHLKDENLQKTVEKIEEIIQNSIIIE